MKGVKANLFIHKKAFREYNVKKVQVVYTQQTFSNNDRENSDKSGNSILCFVCDPIRKTIFLIWHIGSQIRNVLVTRAIGISENEAES